MFLNLVFISNHSTFTRSNDKHVRKTSRTGCNAGFEQKMHVLLFSLIARVYMDDLVLRRNVENASIFRWFCGFRGDVAFGYVCVFVLIWNEKKVTVRFFFIFQNFSRFAHLICIIIGSVDSLLRLFLNNSEKMKEGWKWLEFKRWWLEHMWAM